MVVAAAVYLVNRRWPLAGLGSRSAPETKDTGEAADPAEAAEPAASAGESAGKPADKA